MKTQHRGRANSSRPVSRKQEVAMGGAAPSQPREKGGLQVAALERHHLPNPQSSCNGRAQPCPKEKSHGEQSVPQVKWGRV